MRFKVSSGASRGTYIIAIDTRGTAEGQDVQVFVMSEAGTVSFAQEGLLGTPLQQDGGEVLLYLSPADQKELRELEQCLEDARRRRTAARWAPPPRRAHRRRTARAMPMLRSPRPPWTTQQPKALPAHRPRLTNNSLETPAVKALKRKRKKAA